jgi:lysophospholipid acyltransferase (LPLAT)-like uncharacterized protein
MRPLGQLFPWQIKRLLPPGLGDDQGAWRNPPRPAQRGQSLWHQIAAVGRIEEHQPARHAGLGPKRVAGDHDSLIAGLTGPHIGAQGGKGVALRLDEMRAGSAARQRLQPQRAGSGKRVQHLGVFDAALCPGRMHQHIEQRLPHALRRGSRGLAGGGRQHPSTPFSRDDPHLRSRSFAASHHACYRRCHDVHPTHAVLKRLLRHPAVLRLMAALLGRYLDFALSTTRWTVIGQENFAPFEQGAPVIAAFWHEHLPLMPALWNRARAVTPGLRLHVLVSRHNDGRFIGNVIGRFGLKVAHGSSAHSGQNRGGARGAMALLAALEAGDQVAITPDGPRGPRRMAAPGVAQLAGLSGCAVLPCAAQTSRRRVLGSWDRMIVPLPFARGVLVCAAPIAVAREGGDAMLPVIEAALTAASDAAQVACR